MTEPAVRTELSNHHGVEELSPASPPSDTRTAHSSGIKNAQAACYSLNLFGRWAGWGLVVVGLLIGALTLAGATHDGMPNPSAWGRAGLHSAIQVMEFVLAGWGVRTLTRAISASVLEYLERATVVSDQFSMQLVRALAVLERIADTLETRAATAVVTPAPGIERARAMAEIVRAIRAGAWAEAEERLSQFELEFPDDPELAHLKDELTKTREGLVRESMAQLAAAREASDPDRVFDIHQKLRPSLEEQQRALLEKDLAAWFLTLIHRRLRTGKVQADVVRLAARFAESFAATVEGASVLASLPTLRRSVGLCPRCAQPYTGVAEACPNCLKPGPPSLAAGSSLADIELPE